MLASSMQAQFNPLNSFNDQVTPVSIQVSELYQGLLHEYCSQPTADFIQSQIYLWIIIGLLVVFSLSARHSQANGFMKSKSKSKKKGKALASSMSSSASLTPTGSNNSNSNMMTTSGQLLAHQHEANLLPDTTLGPPGSHSFAPPFAPNVLTGGATSKVVQRHLAIGNIFLVTLISAPIYFISVIFHVNGHNLANHDLVSSVTMILIAFTILIGTFLPVLRRVNRYDDAHLVPGHGRRHQASFSRPLGGAAQTMTLATAAGRRSQRDRLSVSSFSKRLYGKPDATSNSPSAFAMFPEFASTGLRRPSSIGGDSGSHAGGSRRPFADTKESRRQMGVSLANLPVPSADSLRNLCTYNQQNNSNNSGQDANNNRFSRMSEGGPGAHLAAGAATLDAALLNLKLNLNANDEIANGEGVEDDLCQGSSRTGHHKHHSRGHHKPSSNHHHHHHHHSHQSHQNKPSSRLSSAPSFASGGGEKRLIMLDVDPTCPRHGLGSSNAAWSQRQRASAGGVGGSNCLNDASGSGGPN